MGGLAIAGLLCVVILGGLVGGYMAHNLWVQSRY